MNKMLKYGLIVTVVLTLTILYQFSNADFVPFLKYRDISTKDIRTIYDFSIFQKRDTLYTVYVAYSKRTRTIATPWIGKEETWMSIGCGSKGFNPYTNLVFFDSNYISIKDSLLWPRKMGFTKIVLKNDGAIDTVSLVLDYTDNILRIKCVDKSDEDV